MLRAIATSIVVLLGLQLLFAHGAAAWKYETFFWWYDRDGYLTNIRDQNCSTEYANYVAAFKAPGHVYKGDNWNSYCYLVEDCMLGVIRESYSMNYQAAAVILGLMPGLLGSLGVRLAEVSYLSVHRPILSFLLALGSPSVWPTRIFEYDDPAEMVKPGINKISMPSWLDHPKRSMALSMAQYILAAASIANMVEISLQMGRKGVLSWACYFDYGPLLWVVLPVVIHLVASVTYNIEIRQQRLKVRELSQDPRPEAREEEFGLKVSRSNTIRSAITAPLTASWWSSETTICANRPKGLETLLATRKASRWAILLNVAASTMAFVHLVFGTLLFSSLIFVAVYDILNYILWRFLLSTALCRVILLIEMSGLRPESSYYQEQKWERDHAAKLEAKSHVPSPPAMSPTQVQFSPTINEHLKNRSSIQEDPKKSSNSTSA